MSQNLAKRLTRFFFSCLDPIASALWVGARQRAEPLLYGALRLSRPHEGRQLGIS
jgi:hypothetical protein